MSIETCQICKEECTPWVVAHICEDCSHSRRTLIEEVKKQILKLPDWTNVEDKLPEKNGLYLVIVKSKIEGHCYAIRRYDVVYGFIAGHSPRYWMPLPPLPDMEKAE